MSTELFEDRKLQGKFNVTCKYDDGSVRIWSARKEDVVQNIVNIVTSYEKQGYKLTLRQLHYQLVTRNQIINHNTAYKKLGRILDDCRYGGVIDWDSIEDRGRIPHLTYWVSGVKDALEDTISHYRLNRQEGQENHVELWTEKDALSGILKKSTVEYHVQLVVNKGYTSSSAIYRAYERFLWKIEDGQKVTILYFGDHDPSGLDMVRDIRDRLHFMFENGRRSLYLDESQFQVIPIGLSMDQIKQYNLPTNPTKLTDSRSKDYIKEFGRVCWEVDALSPDTLTSIVKTNIEKQIDIKLFKSMIAKENADKKALSKFVNTHQSDDNQ